MSLTAILCHQCGKTASWLKITVPNPDRGWCKECHQDIGPKTITYHFCSSKCMKDWATTYHNSDHE